MIQVFAGQEPDQRFGGDVDIADLQLDGIPDLAIASRFVTGDDGIRHGMASLFIGEAPLIDSVSVSDGQTTITGTNLAPIVLIDRMAVTVLEASSTRLVVEGAGDIILVAGLFGFDAFFLNPPVLPGVARVVDLGFGFNLAGWTGETPIAEALAGLQGSFSGVFTWDPESQSIRSFSPDAPAFINTLRSSCWATASGSISTTRTAPSGPSPVSRRPDRLSSSPACSSPSGRARTTPRSRRPSWASRTR